MDSLCQCRFGSFLAKCKKNRYFSLNDSKSALRPPIWLFYYDQVQDFRIERFLPPAALNITLEKTFIGHRAKYKISESELKAYVDGLWDTYGKYSAVLRSNLNDGEPVKTEEIEPNFRGLNWPSMDNAVKYHSPVERDGGGATYYFEPTTGVTYHRAGYW